jgi:endo-1,4-beta-mannosidase
MQFRLGINYWPASKAMFWWRCFDPEEARHDFQLISGAGFDSARIFLLWEDFQPAPDHISGAAISNLLKVADIAAKNRLSLIVTLFTGHMSGANWLPRWALEDGARGRFRTISGGQVLNMAPRNWYADESIKKAQALLAQSVANVLRKHPAVWAYDLGNENSNCIVPPSRESGVEWLRTIADAIRSVDMDHSITVGLHAEDLEEDRRLGPDEASEVCDFLSMHGYPMYLRWASAPDDERVLPFLGLVTRWLGRHRNVLLEEFGAPAAESPLRNLSVPVMDYRTSANFTRRALQALHRSGFPGAMLWCFADYHDSLWSDPPFDDFPHERYFGLWSNDYSPKPALAEAQCIAGTKRKKWPDQLPWIDILPRDFYRDPLGNLRRFFHDYCESLTREELT